MSVQERPFTRRGILSVVSSVYDPIGFLAPFTLPVKTLLQNLCKMSYSWDEDIPPNYQLQWVGWLEDLKRLCTFSVPRCFKPKGFGQLVSAQLHHFSDASENGYGTVSYLRLQSEDEKIHLAFVLGKARVAPLKNVTIPRMELTAAVLAVRVDRLLKAELQLELENSLFWTDSTTVLRYIKNETKRFHTFVVNRVSAIREATSVSQWRYVDTKRNPADKASRGVKVDYLLTSSRWIHGPDFLSKSEEEWPPNMLDSTSISSDDPEVKGEVSVNAVITTDQLNAVNKLITYFCSWKRLKTYVAWFLQLKKSKEKGNTSFSAQQRPRPNSTLSGHILCPEDLNMAERVIIQYSQMDKFSDEIAALKKVTAGVTKSSHIYKLDPVLEEGLLRVGGRLSKGAMPDDTKHHSCKGPIYLHSHLTAHTRTERTLWKKSPAFHTSSTILDHQSKCCCQKHPVILCCLPTIQRKAG